MRAVDIARLRGGGVIEAMSEAALIYAATGGLAEITISNPARRNAMTLGMWSSLPEMVAKAEADPEIRAIVLKGDGDKAFCAGADISQFGEARTGETAVRAYDTAVARGNEALLTAAKPVIAVVRGFCFGGGLGLAMACDLRLGEAGARFRLPAGRLGLGYGFRNIRTLVQRLGHAGAADVLFSARIIESEEALRIGILSQCWPKAEFGTQVASYLGAIAGNAPLTLKAAKRALVEISRPDALQDEAAVAALVKACFESEDYREGQAAFREKRDPVFRGR